jgi:hypothetical protein
VVDTFLLLLIGLGPKIALVPFLEITDGIDDATKGLVVRTAVFPLAVLPAQPGRRRDPGDALGRGGLDQRRRDGGRAAGGGARHVVVFRVANRASRHLDEGRMLVTEKIFGMLLAALAVRLVLDGLDSVGIIHLADH